MGNVRALQHGPSAEVDNQSADDADDRDTRQRKFCPQASQEHDHQRPQNYKQASAERRLAGDLGEFSPLSPNQVQGNEGYENTVRIVRVVPPLGKPARPRIGAYNAATTAISRYPCQPIALSTSEKDFSGGGGASPMSTELPTGALTDEPVGLVPASATIYRSISGLLDSTGRVRTLAHPSVCLAYTRTTAKVSRLKRVGVPQYSLMGIAQSCRR